MACSSFWIALETLATGVYVNWTYSFASIRRSSNKVVTPRVPNEPAAPRNRSAFSDVEAVTTSPLPKTISIHVAALSKKPYMKELLSPEVPAKPPPTVMPGNSMTTGGTRPCSSVASTSASIGTFGSTNTIFDFLSTLST